eukprot:1447085-Prymnesium_polylepis.1
MGYQDQTQPAKRRSAATSPGDAHAPLPTTLPVKLGPVNAEAVRRLLLAMSSHRVAGGLFGTWTHDAVRIRFRMLNSECFFNLDEMIMLVHTLHALGFEQAEKADLLERLLDGRRRDNRDIENTPVNEVVRTMRPRSLDVLREVLVAAQERLS